MNQWDTWLNSSDFPPPQPSEPINNTNRVAVPPPIVKPPDQAPLSLASPNSPFALVSQESFPGVSVSNETSLERKPSIQLPGVPPISSIAGVSQRVNPSMIMLPDASVAARVNPSMTIANSSMTIANPSMTIANPPMTTLRRTRRRKRGKEDDELYEEAPGKKEEAPIKRRRGRPVLASVVTDDQRKTPDDSDEKRQYQKPKWCHQCKARKRDVIQCCGEGKPRGANNQMYRMRRPDM